MNLIEEIEFYAKDMPGHAASDIVSTLWWPRIKATLEAAEVMHYHLANLKAGVRARRAFRAAMDRWTTAKEYNDNRV